MTTRKLLFLILAASSMLVFLNQAFSQAFSQAPSQEKDKPKLTLDEFFNYVTYDAVRSSPDGHSIAIIVDRPDWDQNFFRTELWLYRDEGGGLIPLTQSGKDSAPQWSPDGAWIAFLSERTLESGKSDGSDDAKNENITQLYVISPNGGEAIPVTTADEDVHAFAWSADSKTLYFATRTPWMKAQQDAHKRGWKDVIQYRGDERGDTIFSVALAGALSRRAEVGKIPSENRGEDDGEYSDGESSSTPGSKIITPTPWRVQQMATAPDGRRLAFVSESISQREERVSEFEIFTVDLGSNPSTVRQLTHNEAVEENIQWARDSRHVFFGVNYGAVDGEYHDYQPRLYWIDADSGATERWAQKAENGKEFIGAIMHYAVTDNGILAAGRVGTEVQIYSQLSPSAPLLKQTGWSGTYDAVVTASHSSHIALIHSALDRPVEVYLAPDISKLTEAQPLTAFNKLFTERALPQAKTYRWTADDGTSIEGMLMYPPGKFEAKNLPMFVFIHGGPDDADGNHFEADWYVWDRLAATHGWLVFEPNYRGSTGYGDKFLERMVPEIVSRPGKDISEGVDSLVKNGTADPAHLAIGGYSYGSYMTNWLITQSTQWKAAVTGAGAVENVANWGNDDTTFDDAFDLGGLPWEQPKRYREEAAIFQMNKVRTPTLIDCGAEDVRVAVSECYLFDHALHNLGVPSELLIFPGEGHELDKNPWHGKIKVREELKWLQKYGGVGTQ
ncbi:MAG: prolyl oligopeptidase family serine peptidase [Terriglobales bacterium]